MDCIELDVEVVVADEAFDIHPPYPTEAEIEADIEAAVAARFANCRAHVDAAWEHAREINPDAHVQAWIVYDGDLPL